MLFIKFPLFILLFLASTSVGILISKKYVYRVKELKEFKTFLNVLKNKIKFTYEPLGEIFKEVSNNFDNNVSNILKNASKNMQKNNVEKAWKMALETGSTNILKEDKEILLTLGKLLGKTDVNGQISQIDQTSEFLEEQIEKAEKERIKNEKLYKTLGMTVGAGLVIILI